MSVEVNFVIYFSVINLNLNIIESYLCVWFLFFLNIHAHIKILCKIKIKFLLVKRQSSWNHRINLINQPTNQPTIMTNIDEQQQQQNNNVITHTHKIISFFQYRTLIYDFHYTYLWIGWIHFYSDLQTSTTEQNKTKKKGKSIHR